MIARCCHPAWYTTTQREYSCTIVIITHTYSYMLASENLMNAVCFDDNTMLQRIQLILITFT